MLDWSKRGEEGQSAPHSHINWEEEEEEEKAMEGGVGEAPPHNLLCAKKSMETGWWSEEEEQRSGASAIGARESFEARGRGEGGANPKIETHDDVHERALVWFMCCSSAGNFMWPIYSGALSLLRGS